MLEHILQAIKGKGEELKNVGVNVGENYPPASAISWNYCVSTEH